MLVYVTNCWWGGEGKIVIPMPEGRGGEGRGKLSFQCLRPSASLRAAGKKLFLLKEINF
jgi:hypothetical protein